MINEQTENLFGGMLSGRYQIIKLLGQGGMAQVYLALDQKTGKKVAVKVMHDDLSNDLVSIKFFNKEARATSNLNHPNIVRTFGFGQDHEHHYIVQEYVEGGSLKELINKNGALPWQTAVPIAIQIGLALDHAHAHGLVHRDIKPHNILITKDRLTKVTDFGIAQAIESNTTGLINRISSGSAHYSSPEQAQGTTMSERSDIYSLGILMYEMVTGRVPFDSDTIVAIGIKHLQEDAPSPSLINSTVPRGLDQIIMKCIQKLPDNRYQNARELVDELEALMTDPNGTYGIVAVLPARDEQTAAFHDMSQGPKYDKMNEIEQITSKRRQSRRSDMAIVMAIILVAVIFMTTISVWGLSRLSNLIQVEPDQSYEVSNYVGRELTEVLETLDMDNVLIDVIYSENATVIIGLITAQTPSPGVMINNANGKLKLTLTVSSGLDPQIIPDMSGQSSAEAEAELTRTYGYKVEIMTENSQIDQGTVIRTIPAAGQKAPRGGSIILIASNGMPMVTMPNFVGKSLTDTRLKIAALNLILGPISSISGVVKEDKRIVIRQSAPAGSEVMEQSIISFTYGTAQDYYNLQNTSHKSTTTVQLPTPSPSPTLTPTPSPTPTLAPTPSPTLEPAPTTASNPTTIMEPTTEATTEATTTTLAPAATEPTTEATISATTTTQTPAATEPTTEATTSATTTTLAPAATEPTTEATTESATTSIP